MLLNARINSGGRYLKLKTNVFAANNSSYACVYNGVDPGLMYLSCFGNKISVDSLMTEIKKNNHISIEIGNGHYFRLECKHAEVFTSRLANSDFYHVIICRKDEMLNKNTENEALCVFAYAGLDKKFNIVEAFKNDEEIPETIINAFYDKLYAFSPVYIRKEWITYLLKNALPHYLYESNWNMFHEDFFDENIPEENKTDNIMAYCLEIPVSRVIEIIKKGLKEKDIFIRDESDETSATMKDINGLDSYLNRFVDSLALKIQGSFDPYFNPEQDKYSSKVNLHDEYVSYMDHLKLFPAQKAVVQACCNAFDEKKKCLYLICEMGTGKTNMSAAIAMADYKKVYGMTSVVMCPGTLCEKWKRTLDAEIPFAETHIIENVFDVIKLRDKIRDKNRKTNLWLIVSKDRMKTNYAVRPAARWKKEVKCINTEYGYPINMDTYVCPECGQPLFTKKNVRRGSRKREVRTYFDETAFVSQNATNKVCMNTIRKYNNKKHKWEEVECGAPLWRACNKVHEGDYTGDSVKWVKVGNDMGWVEPQHMNKLANEYYNDKKNNAVLKKKAIALEDTINGEGIVQTAPKSYCISKYMRKYFKGCIDYAIIDEVHELAGESTLQGEAMGDIVRTAKKSLCLTGTLLNGYAKSIFYMLFRTHPATMIKEGFEYSSSGEMAFTRDFGVYKEISFDAMEGYEAKKKKGTSVKALPGASPLIYTKFLMNNAVFACIDDMADGLPGYTEIPVGIDMEPILSETHDRLTSVMRSYLKGDKRNKKLMSQAALMLTVWPDQPYEQPPLIDPETKQIKYVPPEYTLGINSKDDKCLEIIRANVAQGRKVMVYYAYPGRTDVDRRLPELLNDEGIKTSVLLSKRPDNFQGRMPKWMGAPSANGREAWIDKQIEDGCQVLFVNPKLIQTGLDLISFSTIIFYQVGYNLSDMRQASRRSWRLGQTENVEVYFLYYKHTVQETIMSMMATKLQAAKAIEGKFSEEGLQAMSNNIDILNAVAASVADGVQKTLDIDAFKCNEKTVHNDDLVHKKRKKNLIDVEREYKYMSRPTLKIRTTRKAYDRANEMNMLSEPEKLFAAM